MQEIKRSFSPGKSEIFWCESCNLPLLSESCSICKSRGRHIPLSPPGDIRLCSREGKELLKDLFQENWGVADFLDGRIVLLNKIAGMDRRDQVILEGHHIATLWFDITTNRHSLDLETAGASLLSGQAMKNIIVCHESLLRGHIKGKWLPQDLILSQQPSVEEGDNVILRIGKFSGVGVARRRNDGSISIRIKDVTQKEFVLKDASPDLEAVTLANEGHLKNIERVALNEIRSYLSRTRLPVNISFSGGKDSLASLCLVRKLRPKIDVLFINTALEFPETVEYVKDLCRRHKLKLHEIMPESSFFEQVEIFGPPAKDYRWCCKTNKLGPMTAFLSQQYPRGCVTIEGRRIYESFNRSSIKAVERNPYVPGQTTLLPIRSWRALEVMLYIYWNKEVANPLYDEDYERIGCWLCPASLQSEFAQLKESHPDLHKRWESCLQEWAGKNKLDQRYIDWGFWRWRRHPPKITEIAAAHNISLRAGGERKNEIGLEAARGRSPCGLEYSIEATLSTPQNQPFPVIAQALGMLGEVKYSEEMGAALLKTEKGRATVFADGHIMIIAGKKEAEELLEEVFLAILRAEMCTGCGICMKNCSQGAIVVGDTFAIDTTKCNRCGRCARGCIAADEARKIWKSLGGQTNK